MAITPKSGILGADMAATIYVQFKGKMVKVAGARLPDCRNFIIRYKGMDWSGFRTLTECERQFPELEKREGDDFTVIEC